MKTWLLEGKHERFGRVILAAPFPEDTFFHIGIRTERTMRESLGLIHIASYLISFGWNFSPVVSADEKEFIFLCQNSYIGLSAQLDSYRACVHFARIAKESGANSVFLGGPYASVRSEQIILHQKHIDYVVVGQGEVATLDIITGKILKKGAIKNTPLPIDKLPARARSLWTTETSFMGNKATLVNWSDGCIQALHQPCFFCSICHSVKISRRKVSQVIEELKELSKMGYRSIEIGSDDFPGIVSEKWLEELYEALQINKLSFDIYLHSRARSIKGKKLALLKKIGVKIIQVGFETASVSLKKDYADKATLIEEDELIDRFLQLDLKLSPSFIIGFIGETQKTVQETYTRIQSLKKKNVLAGVLLDPLIALPGSSAFAKLCENHPRWKDADFIEPEKIMRVWFKENTKISLDIFLQEREQILSDMPKNVFIQSLLMKL